jgi:hypothetical protein
MVLEPRGVTMQISETGEDPSLLHSRTNLTACCPEVNRNVLFLSAPRQLEGSRRQTFCMHEPSPVHYVLTGSPRCRV